jgi:hypothetical protein
LKNFVSNFLSILALVCGLFYLLLSGRAEGFVSARALLILPIVILNFALFLCAVWVGFLRYKTTTFGISRNLRAIVGSILIADVFFFTSLYIDSVKVSETKKRGDIIQAEIDRFIVVQGRPPSSLSELSANGFAIPEPALKSSSFRYAPGKYLSFYSVAFTICEKRKEWVCLD